MHAAARAATLSVLALAVIADGQARSADDGLFVRFKLEKPQGTTYFVRVGGFIHNDPWYLPGAIVPEGAEKDPARQTPAGQFTPWLDLKKLAGKRLHGRLARSGGVAELPNVTAEFITRDANDSRSVVIELATRADEKAVARRFEESFRGTLTSFLVSPKLKEDAAQLETASQMTARRLAWAREATGGRAASPKQLIVQTSFWSPQREELNLQEAEVLRLLGFNVVGNQSPAVREKAFFRVPGHTHDVDLSPGVTRDRAEELIAKAAARNKEPTAPGVPFGFSDEICARAKVEGDKAREHFAAWLERHNVRASDLGAARLGEVVPIHTPEELRERQKAGRAAANRVFYYTSRFRQEAATERLRWHTEALHKHVAPDALSSTLVADHPYFSGTGLGMGMGPNPTWGGYPLACDWFDLARRKAVDMAGVEDWMGLQYMYGPGTTWEGFQLMGFQAAIFRSGSRGTLPVMAWITPSDETNLRLKTASALCQGAKHFFYWTYGPTCTSTENYWSDLRGAYDGIVHATRQLAAAEHIIAPGKTRPTRVALFYSISSDLWQPFGYVSMLERRGTYLALVHEQYLVDMLTEEDVEAGRLADYAVLYAADPCIKSSAVAKIEAWVRSGGRLFATTAAGSRNEFDEEVPGLAAAYGIEPGAKVQVQPGDYHVRGALNGMGWLDEVVVSGQGAGDNNLPSPAGGRGGGGEGALPIRFGAIGVKVAVKPAGGHVVGTFKDGSPAVIRHKHGRGETLYVATCPAVSYIKDAKFVPAELKEKWPPAQRAFITAAAREAGEPRLVGLSHPVVEAGVYDAPAGTALVLANFTYQPIEELRVRLLVDRPPKGVRSVEQGALQFSALHTSERDRSGERLVIFQLRLGTSDVVVVE